MRNTLPLTALFTFALAAACGAQTPQASPAPAAAEGSSNAAAQQPRHQAADESPVGLTIYSSADPVRFDPQKFIAQQRNGYNPRYVRQVPGFGVVRETRSLDLDKGVNTVDFVDVARFIDPTTVSFTDLGRADGQANGNGHDSDSSASANRQGSGSNQAADSSQDAQDGVGDSKQKDAGKPNGKKPGANQEQNASPVSVLKQTFLFDLVSPQKLMEKYLDRQVTLRVPTDKGYDKVTGKLLASRNGDAVLQTDQGVQIIPRQKAQVVLGKLPGGLITRPTLRWKVASDVAGRRRARTSYQTAGITWRADYNLVLNHDDTQADLGSWVTILNLSGKAYRDAKLKLIAGDVNKVRVDRYGQQAAQAYSSLRTSKGSSGFKEKSFYTYHLYTLPRRTTIADNTTQQLTLFPTVHEVNVEKVLVYYGLSADVNNWRFTPNPITDRNFGDKSNKNVDVYIRFKNSKKNHLGMPLPRGKVRVYKKDPADDTLEFVGEDLIDHTPKNEKVLVKTGQAFDIVGERKQTNIKVDATKRDIHESFRIELRNHKGNAANVIIKENLYRWSNWEITKHSDDFKKVNSRTIHFNVTVPANGKKVVTYTVHYWW